MLPTFEARDNNSLLNYYLLNNRNYIIKNRVSQSLLITPKILKI